MASVRPLMPATFVALLALGCGRKNPDPTHLELSDFDSSIQLQDTLAQRFPPGSRVSGVWEDMQRNGFNCGERGVVKIDGQAPLGNPKPNLECWGSNRTQPFNKRVWLVTFPFDTTRRVT
ncbi:MAG TPA: hypothetical protein VF105_01375, partial [Gemmatimonadaceae bacterium]